MGSVREQLYNRVECKVGLVGDRGVGKTSLVKKFIGEDFLKPISACYATPVKHVKTINVDNKKVKYTIHESSDHMDPVSTSQLKEVDVIMLCFNICDPPTLASAIQAWVPALPPAPLLLVGCQADLRTDRMVLASLTRLGQAPVTANQAMFFTRQVEAVMYVETEARISSKSSTSAFELAAKTCLGQFSRQSSVMSSSSSITSPLIKSRSRSSIRDSYKNRAESSVTFWERFKSPSSTRRSRTKSPRGEKFSSLRLKPRSESNVSVRSKSSNMSDSSMISISLGRNKTPRMSRRFSGLEQVEKMVTIKCIRLTVDKNCEEIEIEVPEAVYDNLEEEEESECIDTIEGEKDSWGTKLKGLFVKS